MIIMKWIRDEEFARGGKIPMTKFETRVLTLTLLNIGAGDVFWDIGAGTGSIAAQAALLGAEVYAVEREADGVALIQQNVSKFGVHLHVLRGVAPDALALLPDCAACFLGGSGGQLESITRAIHERMRPGGRLAANFITPENFAQFTSLLREFAYANVQTRLIQTAVSDERGMLRGQNPVFIVTGIKQ